MSYNTALQSNNADLQAILNAVNALPNAGTGGGAGGGSYTGDLYSYGTATAQPGSGATSAQFSGIPQEPDFFVCYVDTFNAEQWNRTGAVVYDGETICGHEVVSGTDEVNFYENTNDASDYRWRYTYSDGTLTLASASTSKGGYWHNPGTYTLLYAYKDNENGTVAIEKKTAVSTGQVLVSFGELQGEVVWFTSIMCGNLDAQSTVTATPVFLNEKGAIIVSNGSTAAYSFTENYTTYKYDNGVFKVGTGNHNIGINEYSLIYAYYPPVSTVVDTSDANVTSDQMLVGASGYAKGRLVEGNIQSQQAQNITPSTTEQYIEPGVYLAGRQTISAIQTQSKTTTTNGTVYPDTGKYLSSVVVNVPASGITPSGALNITANGTYDVTNYASATVNVSTGGGTSIPDGAVVVQKVIGEEKSTQIGSGYNLSITYGDAVEINDSIALAFVGTTKSLGSISDSTDFSVLYDKYVRTGSTTGTFYYIPSEAGFDVGGSTYSKTLTCDRAQTVTLQKLSL